MLALFLLAGGAAAQKSKAVEPCRLLTKTDAQKILGGKVRLVENGNQTTRRWCNYKAVGKSAEIELLMIIHTGPEEAAEENRGNRQINRATGDITDVSNVGDDAWAWQYTGTGREINVLKNNVTFTISVYGRKNPTAQMKSLARRIAAKL